MADTKELLDLGYPSNFEASMGLRTIKMVRPRCDTIKVGDTVLFEGCFGTERWTNGTCPHDPYASMMERREVRPKYEAIVDAENKPTGRMRVTGEETEVWHERRWNLEQVPLSVRVNSGRGPEYYRALGWKDPQDMGLAPFCQFTGCWSQKIKFRDDHGDYCSEAHAKLIVADESEDWLEILNPKKRARQMAEISVTKVA